MKKIVLGIETSCDDTSIGILEKSSEGVNILSHKTFDQEEVLKTWGGVVPEIAARNHLQKLAPLLKITTEEAKIEAQEIDLIGVTSTPGLLGPLLTGLNAAKTLSMLIKKPIYPVNHLYAHLEAVHLTEKVSYPYLGLLISGGHSLFFLVSSSRDFRVLGSSIDDAAGEAFDKGGKLLDLGYPAGRIIDSLAKWGDPTAHEFPIGLKSSADCRFSFSGLKTSLRVFLEKNPEILTHKPKDFSQKLAQSQAFYDVCASYQEAIVKAVVLKTKYAIKAAKERKDFDKLSIVAGGGVACNSAIRKRMLAKFNDVFFAHPDFCSDNGAMIAHYALLNMESAIPFPECLELDARGRFINKKDFNASASKSK